MTKRKNSTTRIAMPVDKFYSKFLRNGIIKFPTPSGECSYSDYLLAGEKQGKEPPEWSINKLLYNYACLYKSCANMEDDINTVLTSYRNILDELGKENPNNELYILHTKHKPSKT